MKEFLKKHLLKENEKIVNVEKREKNKIGYNFKGERFDDDAKKKDEGWHSKTYSLSSLMDEDLNLIDDDVKSFNYIKLKFYRNNEKDCKFKRLNISVHNAYGDSSCGFEINLTLDELEAIYNELKSM